MLTLSIKIIKLLILHLNLRYNKVVYGKRLRGNGCRIRNDGEIVIGDNVALDSKKRGEIYNSGLFTYLEKAKIKIGNNTIISGANIHSRELVKIGSYCLIGSGTVILDNNSHSTSIDPKIRHSRNDISTHRVIVGDNVWIGIRSLICKGVTIGDNAIVAASSVVTADVPSNCIVAGNPAKIVKKLA
jgi:acetyltransferase-like isoleucine patch superfamily enzyme